MPSFAHCSLQTDWQSWALSVFLNTFNNKKLFFSIFYQVNLFLHWVLFKKPTPSQINLIKNAKNHFLLVKKFLNTSSAQLCWLTVFSWMPLLFSWASMQNFCTLFKFSEFCDRKSNMIFFPYWTIKMVNLALIIVTIVIIKVNLVLSVIFK